MITSKWSAPSTPLSRLMNFLERLQNTPLDSYSTVMLEDNASTLLQECKPWEVLIAICFKLTPDQKAYFINLAGKNTTVRAQLNAPADEGIKLIDQLMCDTYFTQSTVFTKFTVAYNLENWLAMVNELPIHQRIMKNLEPHWHHFIHTQTDLDTVCARPYVKKGTDAEGQPYATNIRVAVMEHLPVDVASRRHGITLTTTS